MSKYSLDLDGRVAFVTGSSRGIGWAVARALAAHGANLVLNGRSSQETLDERVEELRGEFGREVMGVPADVGDPRAVSGCYREIHRRFGRLDMLVNNAGILEDAVIGMIGADALKRLFEVNTFGVIHNLQAAARLMRRSGGGSIVNVGSIVGIQGNRGQVAYGATKAAILGITKSAAKELAPDGIRVNAVAPGFIDTDMVRGLPDDIRKENLAKIGMNRIGQPEDVAAVVLFLVSDLSSYMTGQVLGVDGGMVM